MVFVAQGRHEGALADLRVVGLGPFLAGPGASLGLAAATLFFPGATRDIWERVFGGF
jgi:hypothetical protein